VNLNKSISASFNQNIYYYEAEGSDFFSLILLVCIHLVWMVGDKITNRSTSGAYILHPIGPAAALTQKALTFELVQV